MLADCRALTIHQPWASLIACGEKTVENRTWSTSYRGPVLIHASVNRKLRPLYDEAVAKGFDIPAEPIYGQVLAVATLVDCVAREQLAAPYGTDPFAEGPICWCLSDIVRLAAPLPLVGQQGLYRPDPLTISRVRERVMHAART